MGSPTWGGALWIVLPLDMQPRLYSGAPDRLPSRLLRVLTSPHGVFTHLNEVLDDE